MAHRDRNTQSGAGRLVFLLSGSGRTLANLLQSITQGVVPAEIVRVISTRRNVRGVDIAHEAGIPCSVIRPRDFVDSADFSRAIFDQVDGDVPDLIVCGGFLSKLVIPDRYIGKLVNIHPSLLPLFGGRGYYGDRVHRAVLESGMRVSGCTVHFLNNDYDAGPIIAQECVPVYFDDEIESVAARVFARECELYPRVVDELLNGSIRLVDGRVVQAEREIGNI